jgi:hypothetical protein
MVKMHVMRCLLAAAIGLMATLALAACDSADKPGKTETGTATVPGYIASRSNILPDWLQIARTPQAGFVQYNARTIYRDAAAGTTDVWVQLIHRDLQTYEAEDEAVKRLIAYNKERYLYRFRCAAQTFAIVEHQILGEGDVAIETVKTPPRSDSDFRAIGEGGVAQVLYPPACKAA